MQASTYNVVENATSTSSRGKINRVLWRILVKTNVFWVRIFTHDDSDWDASGRHSFDGANIGIDGLQWWRCFLKAWLRML